jgi:hypothetical protein
MPNSRIESSGIWSEDQLELLGAWTTDGNNLLSGGGNIIGSLDNFPFYFVTNGLRRASFNELGELCLIDSPSNFSSFKREKVKTCETNSDEEVVIHSIYLPDDTLMNFSSKVLYLDRNGISFGTLARDISVLRKGTNMIFSKPTFPITERNGEKASNLSYRQNGSSVEIVVKGILSTNLKWSGQFNYQGTTNY